jgi:hypothetical protein
VDVRGYYDISLRPSAAIAERGLAELRRRTGSVRKVVNGPKAPFYATPRGVLGALQTSQRRLKVASRATVRATHVADTLNAFALRRAVAGVGSVVSRRLASERARCVSAVELRLRRLFEKRLYRRQLKLRLPRTNVSRKNLRHGGHVLFARNTLKAPTTLEGKRNQMLAPTIS